MAITINGDTGISSIGALSGVTSVSSAAADTPVILQDSSSNSNTCRAWVNFNGTGTVAIRADFNVSSITDNGTGDYTVNFTNAMPDVNYSAVMTGSATVGGGTTNGIVQMERLDAGPALSRTTTTFRFLTLNGSFNVADSFSENISIFR